VTGGDELNRPSDEKGAGGESNVLSFLERATARVPDRAALVFGDGKTDGLQTTFSQLWRRAARLGTALGRVGLEPGDRAIVMIPMSPELYGVLLGLLKMGCVAVFVDPWIGWRQIAAFCAFAEPRAYIGVGRSHLLRWMDSRLRSLPITITTGRRLGRLPAARTLAEIEAATASAEPDELPYPVTAEDPALITFTSGSSGLPKGTNRTHRFLAAQHHALAAEFSYRDEDVDMPMFPIFALNNLARGITSVVPQMDFRRVDRVDAERIIAQMRQHQVTTATASPPFFDRLAERVEQHPGERPALRRILSGGAPVSEGQLRAWRRAFPDTEIVVVYGSTEAEPVAHIGADERLEAVSDLHPRAPGFCVGRPTSQVATRLVAIQSDPLPADPESPGADGIGELLVTGNHVCKDYFRNSAAVRENKLIDPTGEIWHRMGDTGYFDAAGRFWLVGRVHSTIFHARGTVHPQLVEQAAAGDDPRVRRAAAVGLEGGDGGVRVVLVLEGDAGAELQRAAAERLSSAGLWADEIVVTTERLPLDPRHRSKIDYPRLRQRLELRGRP
jgi:acyl-CoA synthetase (AMP-forming)/AMP-acid ligase II